MGVTNPAQSAPFDSARDTTDALRDEWVRERPDARGYRRDAVTAVVLAAATGVSVTLYDIVGIFGHPSSPWLAVAWVIVVAGPLVFRRRWPEIVALVVAAAFIVGQQLLSIPEYLFGNILLFIALYTLGAWGRNRLRARLVRLLIIAGMFLWLFIGLFLAVTSPDAMPGLSRAGTLSPFAAYGLIQVITNLLYFGAAYYFGNSAYESARSRAELEARTRELAAERERSAAQAVALERVRIARELHDVVAHHVSVMGVQAGAARRVLSSDPQRASEALSAVESNAREAVDELHTMLSTLRSDEVEETAEPPSAGASTRGIQQLPDLVDASERAGVPATFTTVGEPRPVPGTVDLCVYRVAQEALTNVRKHAGAGAKADVRIRYLPDAVELDVSDTGTISSLASSSTAGLGLVGMRERVAAVGGRIEVGPKQRGGFAVRARFPVPAAQTLEGAGR